MAAVIKRAVRVAERVREELSAKLRELRDPRLENVIVSRVELTDDLQLARVYVRHALGLEAPQAKKAALRGLEAASGRLRRGLGQELALRYTPELRFFHDDAQDSVDRVEELLREIRDEKKE